MFPPSYASENSHLITVSLGEDRGAKKLFLFLLIVFCTAISFYAHSMITGSETTVRPFLLPFTIRQGGSNSSEHEGHLKMNTEEADHEEVPSDFRATVNVLWGELQRGERCLGYKTRKYSAQLLNLPFFSNWMETCKTAQIEIHGRVFDRPQRCERNVSITGSISVSC